MKKVFINQKGLNIIGQGGKIILFTLPSLVAAILVHLFFPKAVALPESFGFLKLVGVVLLVLGLILWGTALIQLLLGFSNSRLVTSGAYGVVRNPIYSSATFFLLPATALLTLTWIYLIPSIFLYIGVIIFIGTEEKQLTNTFGKQYVDYLTKVDRLIPFKKP